MTWLMSSPESESKGPIVIKRFLPFSTNVVFYYREPASTETMVIGKPSGSLRARSNC